MPPWLPYHEWLRRRRASDERFRRILDYNEQLYSPSRFSTRYNTPSYSRYRPMDRFSEHRRTRKVGRTIYFPKRMREPHYAYGYPERPLYYQYAMPHPVPLRSRLSAYRRQRLEYQKAAGAPPSFYDLLANSTRWVGARPALSPPQRAARRAVRRTRYDRDLYDDANLPLVPSVGPHDPAVTELPYDPPTLEHTGPNRYADTFRSLGSYASYGATRAAMATAGLAGAGVAGLVGLNVALPALDALSPDSYVGRAVGAGINLGIDGIAGAAALPSAAAAAYRAAHGGIIRFRRPRYPEYSV